MWGLGRPAGPALREGAGVTEFLSYTITGLSLAAILAVAASGLVLTYTTTGVFNFAHGAIGMLGAFAYWQLRFEWNWPAPISIAVVLLVLGPLFGAFLEVAIFRGLQGTTDTVKLVVTVSLLFSMIGIANWIWNPTEAHNATKFFNTTRPYFIGDVPITRHELITIIVAVLVAIGLRYLLYHTRAGIAMRAAVDDRPLAALHGARPDQSSMLAWAIGCSLAALSGILFVGTIDLASTPMALLIVNAYAAAMIGRLRSLPYTFVGALMLGLLSGYLQGYLVVKNNQYFDSTFVSAVPVIVLFIVLLILPSSRLRAQGIARTREIIPMPTMRGTFIFSAVIVAGSALAIPLLTRSNTVTMARLFGIGIVALSMVPLIGLAGQVSLAQWSLAGLGAITMAHLGVGGTPLGILWAFVLTATVGALIALPTLRLSGIYLALATAAFAVFLERWIFGLPPFNLPFTDVKISIFGTGSLTVDRLKLFGYQFDTEYRQLMLLATTFALLAIFVAWLRRGAFGRRLLAMKDSPAACATVGMNLTFTKLAVFSISAGIAGIGGALIGGLQRSTNPQDWQFAAGLPVFMVGVVGGIARIGGPLFAGISLATLVAMPTWPILRNVSWFPNLTAVTPGLMGIGLGRNPNGAVADIREAFDPLPKRKVVFGMFLAVVAALYTIVLVTNIGAWWFVIGSVIALIAFTQIAAVRAQPDAEIEAEAGVEFADVPLEWVGIDRAFTPEDVQELDERLGLAEVR
jgi:branched-chain amino acid transport system permease protein